QRQWLKRITHMFTDTHTTNTHSHTHSNTHTYTHTHTQHDGSCYSCLSCPVYPPSHCLWHTHTHTHAPTDTHTHTHTHTHTRTHSLPTTHLPSKVSYFIIFTGV